MPFPSGSSTTTFKTCWFLNRNKHRTKQPQSRQVCDSTYIYIYKWQPYQPSTPLKTHCCDRSLCCVQITMLRKHVKKAWHCNGSTAELLPLHLGRVGGIFRPEDRRCRSIPTDDPDRCGSRVDRPHGAVDMAQSHVAPVACGQNQKTKTMKKKETKNPSASTSDSSG